MRRRILHRNDDEGWEGLVARIRALAAESEARWNEKDADSFAHRIAAAISSGQFLPNSPLLVNCANERRRLLACFVVDARRPMDEFLPILRDIHDGMGGVGYALDPSMSIRGAADFIRRVDHDTHVHQSSRPRPASTAVTVPIHCAQIDALFDLSGSMHATSLNAGLSDEFMSRVVAHDRDATAKLTELARTIHRTGQPGVVFTDRIQRIARDAKTTFAANVCGEAPLAADESGVLGSINLVQCLEAGAAGQFHFDEERFAGVVRLAVRFLDGVLDLHSYGYSTLELNSLATRKIGVGVMGFAHFLALLGIRYGDDASIAMAKRVARALSNAACAESERLAAARGRFPAWREELGIPPRRNAALTAIAATSSLALLVGTTGGIEPIYSYMTAQRVIDQTIEVLDPIVSFFGAHAGVSADELTHRLGAGESLAAILGSGVAARVPVAHEIRGEKHIEIQAAFQEHIDGGISKTLNCAADTRAEDIVRWLLLAHQRGCMGLTIYRDASRSDQPVVKAS